MKHEITVIKALLKMALDLHLEADWTHLHAAFDKAFDDLEARFDRLETSVAKLEAERRDAEGRAA